MAEALLVVERLPLTTFRVASGAMETCEFLVKVRELIVVEELIFEEADWALVAANTTAVADPGAPADGDPEEEGDQLDWDHLELSWPTQ